MNSNNLLISKNELESQNLEEFEDLLKEFIKLKVARFIEIGSLYGWTLQHFINYSENNSTAISIDLPVKNFVGPTDRRVATQEYNYRHVWPKWAKEKNCKLYLIPSESQKQETLQKAKDILQGQLIDFLFIDGNHMYDYVKLDYQMYKPLVRKGGIIAFHDIGKNEEGGVYRLWENLKKEHTYKEFLKDPKQEKGIGMLYI